MDEISNEEFHNRTRPMRRLLVRAADKMLEIGQNRDWDAAPDSPLLRESEEFSPNVGYSAAFTLLYASVEHLRAFAYLLDRTPPFGWSPLPVARAAIETAARMWWVCDPDCDARQRAARAFELWRTSIAMTGKIPDFDAAKQNELYADLAGRLAQYDIPHRVGDDGAVTKVGDNAPPFFGPLINDLYGDAAYGSRIYGWLSGAGHGDIWILAESFEAHAAGNRRHITPQVTLSTIATATHAIVGAVTNSYDRWAALQGWNDDWEPWSRYYRQRADELYRQSQ